MNVIIYHGLAINVEYLCWILCHSHLYCIRFIRG